MRVSENELLHKIGNDKKEISEQKYNDLGTLIYFMVKLTTREVVILVLVKIKSKLKNFQTICKSCTH